MTIFSLIRETAPVIRSGDQLTEDHPHRGYPAARPVRDSIILRAAVFLAVLVATVLVYMAVRSAIVGSFTLSASSWAPALSILIASVVAYLILTMILESRVWPSEIAPSRALGLLKGILAGFVLVSLSILILAGLGVYRIESFEPGFNPWPALFSVGLVAAVSEEILFRGVIFRLIEEPLGTWGASLVSALGFGLAHITNPDATWWGALAITIEAGILIAAVYTLTRSLWWCVGLHFAWNVAEGPLYGSIVSGTGETDSWIVSSWHGPEILTGGSFGLEASIVPVIIMGLVGITLLEYARRHSLIVAPAWTRKRAASQPSEPERNHSLPDPDPGSPPPPPA